jgi:hypothetical protein
MCEFEKGRRGLTLSDPQFFVCVADYLTVPIEAVLDAANIPKNKEDERFYTVYTMFRNKALSRRVIGSVDALNSTSDDLNVLTTNSNRRIRHLCQTLQSQIIELKSALQII